MGKLGQNGISDDPDEELRKYLDQDDVIEFERKQQLVSSIWQDQDVPQLEEKPRNTVGSVPPVKLYVGKIPQGLKKQGLINTFVKFGELIDVDLIRNSNSSHNFGFVTFLNREAAGEAISFVNNAPPLYMTVRYSRKDKSQEEGFQKKIEELFISNQEMAPLNKEGEDDWEKALEEKEEEDWDEVIRKEEEMMESLDKFREDFSSGDEFEIPVETVQKAGVSSQDIDDKPSDCTNEKKAKTKCVPCKRCGRESVSRCSNCGRERYCGQICQALDWPRHQKECKIIAKTKSMGQVNSNPKTTSEIATISVPKEEEGKLCLAPISIPDSEVGKPTTPHQSADRPHGEEAAKCGDASSCKPAVFLETDLPPCVLHSAEADQTLVQLLEVAGNWAIVTPLSGGGGKLATLHVLKDSYIMKCRCY